jgi:hypothetical protein
VLSEPRLPCFSWSLAVIRALWTKDGPLFQSFPDGHQQERHPSIVRVSDEPGVDRLQSTPRRFRPEVRFVSARDRFQPGERAPVGGNRSLAAVAAPGAAEKDRELVADEFEQRLVKTGSADQACSPLVAVGSEPSDAAALWSDGPAHRGVAGTGGVGATDGG